MRCRFQSSRIKIRLLTLYIRASQSIHTLPVSGNMSSAGGNVLPQSAQTEVAGNDVARRFAKFGTCADPVEAAAVPVDENTSNAVITVLDASTNQVVRDKSRPRR